MCLAEQDGVLVAVEILAAAGLSPRPNGAVRDDVRFVGHDRLAVDVRGFDDQLALAVGTPAASSSPQQLAITVRELQGAACNSAQRVLSWREGSADIVKVAARRDGHPHLDERGLARSFQSREIVPFMTNGPSLSRLEVVRPRDVWQHEALNFTPWLLANVDVLSDLLGMDLVLERAEHPVGDFSLDLIGYDQSTNDVVIVENQLEVSDHTHLGQILTYAAGTAPTTIVWIATGFRPEHRAAIDWLNERTDDHTRFFGVQIEVVRIGTSDPAPAFRLVAQPNDWEKTVRKTTAAAGEVSTRTATYRRFWEGLLERIRTEYPTWTRGRTSDQSWVNTLSGVPGAVLSMAFRRDGLVMQLYFEDRDAAANSERFEALRARQAEFESMLGTTPIWDDMPGRKAARIVVVSDQFQDVADEDQWPAMMEWLIEWQLRFRAAIDAISGSPSQ